MIDFKRIPPVVSAGFVALLLSPATLAQSANTVTREVELGALFTSGNTDEESLNFAGAINIDREQWDYAFTLDGLYSASDSRVKGQRFSAMARANYEISEFSFFQTRVSHEDDRFSGFDSQSDVTFSFGTELLRHRANMSLTGNAGIGARYSRLEEGGTQSEPILRLATEYLWTLSESAEFGQDISVETGSDSNIYRSLTSIETDIMENLSLRFSLKIKHQTEVPIGKDKTDTETAVTFVMRF
ncbi:MAG: DUF481 domain-containing protein [Pseudohongiellaceae bacterium]